MDEIVTWLNKDLTKMIQIGKINSFQYYPQVEGGKLINTLRVVTDGGDVWFEKNDAENLYKLLIEKIKAGKFGVSNIT